MAKAKEGETTAKQEYVFPELERVVEANSVEEANSIINNIS